MDSAWLCTGSVLSFTELAPINMFVEKCFLFFILSVIYLGTAVERRTTALFLFSLRGEVRDFGGTILITEYPQCHTSWSIIFTGHFFPWQFQGLASLAKGLGLLIR